MATIRLLTPTLGILVALSLFAQPSDASPAPRESTVTKATKRTPPPRKQLDLSPEVRARLSTATVTRKPVRYVPLATRDVREEVSAEKRPTRVNPKGKPKRVTNAELTDELNAIERRLASHGYSLRDNRTVVYRDHQPNRAKLDQQVQRVRAVAETKPERAPMSGEQLRARVRGQAKPPARRSLGPGAANNGLWVSSGPKLQAQADFQWKPSIGESDSAMAYLDTRANFQGHLDGLDAGLRGQFMVQAGAYVLGERIDVVRFDSGMEMKLDGTRTMDVTVTFPGGYEYPIYEAGPDDSPEAGDKLNLFDYEQTFGTKLWIIGYPIDVELTVAPTVTLGYDASFGADYVVAGLQPEITVEATLEVFIDAFLASVGAGGSVVLVDAAPDLRGAAYFGDHDGHTTINAYAGGWMHVRFLDGRFYLFLELGLWPFEFRLEHELWEYEGWSYDFPLFRWNSASEH